MRRRELKMPSIWGMLWQMKGPLIAYGVVLALLFGVAAWSLNKAVKVAEQEYDAQQVAAQKQCEDAGGKWVTEYTGPIPSTRCDR